MQQPCFTPRTSVICRRIRVLHKTEFLSEVNWEFGSLCPESLPLQQAAERTGHLPSCGIILFWNFNKRPCWNMTSMSDDKMPLFFFRYSFQKTSRTINVAKSFIRNFWIRSSFSYQKPWESKKLRCGWFRLPDHCASFEPSSHRFLVNTSTSSYLPCGKFSFLLWKKFIVTTSVPRTGRVFLLKPRTKL